MMRSIPTTCFGITRGIGSLAAQANFPSCYNSIVLSERVRCTLNNFTVQPPEPSTVDSTPELTPMKLSLTAKPKGSSHISIHITTVHQFGTTGSLTLRRYIECARQNRKRLIFAQASCKTAPDLRSGESTPCSRPYFSCTARMSLVGT
jgi:hypothetical protein